MRLRLYVHQFMSKYLVPHCTHVRHAVAQFVESLLSRRKVRVRFPMVSLYFTLTRTFRPHSGAGTDSTSKKK